MFKPHSESLVLHALEDGRVISLEQMTERIPQLSWSELFQAVDRLSRCGELRLRRKRFTYYVSLPRVAEAFA